MKMKNLLASITLMMLVAINSATATIIVVNENFDTYADSAAMKAVWGGAGNLGTLDTSLSYSPNNSAAHPGGAVNSYLPGIGSLTPSATQNLVLTAKVYDNAVVANDRITVGLRTGAAPLFEMGRYNDWAPLPTSPVHTYGIRALSLGNGITPSPGWRPFLISGNPIPATAGWHTYEAVFSIESGLSISLDLNSNGTIDSTLQFAGDGTTAFGNFTDLRFGGPSNLSSTGGGANFDDIRLAMVDLVPEPTTLLLAGLLGIAMGCVRKRC
jgi:hypothetical protein